MGNTNLSRAKRAKNDEFYTQFGDIEKEMMAYLDYDPDVFRGKTILLPCDDPEWSNFTKFFAQNFSRFGLKKLISTSFALESKTYKTPLQLSLFEVHDPRFDEYKTNINGKIFTLRTEITVREICEGFVYNELEGKGLFGLAGKLTIQPEYQRNYIYATEGREKG